MPIRNQDSSPLTVIVEPWAEEILLAPGQEIVVNFEGPPGGEIEVENKPGMKVLHGWPGSVFSVEPPQSDVNGRSMTSELR